MRVSPDSGVALVQWHFPPFLPIADEHCSNNSFTNTLSNHPSSRRDRPFALALMYEVMNLNLWYIFLRMHSQMKFACRIGCN